MSAADIARLANVGRSAVSNWRRRYPDFPRPTGGTPGGPLFALAEVEAWLRDQGKLFEVPLTERAWQELRARAGDDLQLAATLADAGELMVRGGLAGSPAVLELAAALGRADAFEALFGRLQEMQGRSASATPADIAELMAALAAAGPGTGAGTEAGTGARTAAVLDPACGTGELLLAAQDHGASRLFGQDAGADSVRLASIRLRLGELGTAEQDITVRAEDGLVRDAFPGVAADAVLADLLGQKRTWMPEADPGDPRWVFGVPPRLEPELAWVQHMLAHLSAEGLAVALLPAAAAARRPGRRIRAQLLRKGALRAVVALSATQHLWLLRKPGAEAPGSVLMAAADPDRVLAIWRRFTADPSHDEPGVSRAVPIIDLLDDEVDLTPSRHISAPPAEHAAERFSQARERLMAMLSGLGGLAPELQAARQPREFSFVTIAELVRLGHLEVRQAPVRGDVGAGNDALLTVEDVIEGRPASGRGLRDARWVTVRSGDVVAVVSGGRFAVRVLADDGAILGPGLTVVRVDPGRLDAHFVAGALRSAGNARVSTAPTGTMGRADVLRAQIPRLSLAEQRGYGDAFRRVDKLESAVRSAAAVGAELAQLLADGVSGGTFEPPDTLESPR